MPAQTYDALLRSLAKGELAPVYYLHGPEDILKDEAVDAILDRALEPGLRDFNLDQRSAGQLDPEAVFTLCTTLPMMAARRAVVLREIEGLSYKEMAHVIGAPIGTIMSRLARARRRLQDALGGGRREER